MECFKLTGNVALVTGTGTGIGRALLALVFYRGARHVESDMAVSQIISCASCTLVSGLVENRSRKTATRQSELTRSRKPVRVL